MKTIEISLENARKAYQEAGGQIKQTLLKLIGKKLLFDNIMDAVKSYKDACEIDGIFPLTINDFDFLPERDREYHFADHQYTVIRRVLNEGWQWEPGQYGYYPVFNRPPAAGGPGFSYDAYYFDLSISSVGARRTFKTSDLAIYAGKQFLSIHSIIHNEL